MEAGEVMAPREFPSLAGASGTWVKGLVVLLSLVFGALPLQAKDYEVERQRIE